MSFFRSGASNTAPPPAPSYDRIPDGSDYNLPQGPRSARRPPPPSAQYNPPQNAYNDPSSALFEKSSYRKNPPRSGGRYAPFIISFVPVINYFLFGSFGVASSPSDSLALTNCLIAHPSDFPQGQHVLINGIYALTVR